MLGSVELCGGAAGCVDPTGLNLKLLSIIKELHFLGLRAAGVNVIAIIAASKASHESFKLQEVAPAPGETKRVALFVAHPGEDTYEGVPIYATPHPKFVSPTCINNKGVAVAIGAPLGDRLAVASRVLDGYAEVAAAIVTVHGASLEETARAVYEGVRTDPSSRAVTREWENRFESTSTPEVEAALKKVMREQSKKGGDSTATAGKARGVAAGRLLADGTGEDLNAEARNAVMATARKAVAANSATAAQQSSVQRQNDGGILCTKCRHDGRVDPPAGVVCPGPHVAPSSAGGSASKAPSRAVCTNCPSRLAIQKKLNGRCPECPAPTK